MSEARFIQLLNDSEGDLKALAEDGTVWYWGKLYGAERYAWLQRDPKRIPFEQVKAAQARALAEITGRPNG